jgi:hypothetical protein
MAAWRRAIELALGEEDTAKFRSIAQSRTVEGPMAALDDRPRPGRERSMTLEPRQEAGGLDRQPLASTPDFVQD